MSFVTECWQRFQCPITDGIYFPDDTFMELAAFTVASCRVALTGSEPVGKLYLESPLAEDDSFQVFGGETSWEGYGFLALVSKSDLGLVWLIHSSQSEPFREAQLTPEAIIATSSQSPFSFHWTVPIAAPNMFTIRKACVD